MLLSCLYITQGNNLRSLQPELACDGLQAGNLVVFYYLLFICPPCAPMYTDLVQKECNLKLDYIQTYSESLLPHLHPFF